MSGVSLITAPEMSGCVSKVEVKLSQIESLVCNGKTYYHTRLNLQRPYEVLYVDSVGDSIFIYLRYGFVQNFEMRTWIFFFGDGPVDISWQHIGTYPVVQPTSVNIFKKNKDRILNVFCGSI